MVLFTGLFVGTSDFGGVFIGGAELSNNLSIQLLFQHGTQAVANRAENG